MKIRFYKYHGTGNDFIMIDGIEDPEIPQLSNENVRQLCDRRFGIGADGLIVLRPSEKADFYMEYFNADGQISSLCGNGSRCAVQLAKSKDYGDEDISFMASDGLHKARIEDGVTGIEMFSSTIKQLSARSFLLDTGSPHYVKYVNRLDDVDVHDDGKAIRYSDDYIEEGVNVNFVEKIDSKSISVATYERGVEGETYSCGTGVTAAAIVHLMEEHPIGGKHTIQVVTKGGSLSVDISLSTRGIEEIWLNGPAEHVYNGEVYI